ncbi:hypothetical protein ACFYR1_49750, partial [Streptomyces canus]
MSGGCTRSRGGPGKTTQADHQPTTLTQTAPEQGKRQSAAGVLSTHEPVGKPLTGHTDSVEAVATVMIDDRPVAVTGGWDGTVRLWDLTTHEPVGKPLTG